MINKLFTIIHNKYSTLFKFIFFLRYLFGIIFFSIALFLLIPHFFNYEKKDKIIKKYLFESYGLTINEYKSIKYNSFPTPNLEIKDVDASINASSIRMNVIRLNIYLKLGNIYNNEIFKANKIILNNNEFSLLDSDLKILAHYIYNLKKKLSLKNLGLKIYKKDTLILNIEEINFSNYGYNRNIIRGELFNKKFKILINHDFSNINFKLLKSGISADISFNENKKEDSIISGVFKSKLLDSKLKFSFDYDQKKLNIYNSYFRNKNLSFNNEATITYQPFFSSNLIIKIEDFNAKFFKKININQILYPKNLIKKINATNEIIFKPKGLSKNLIDELNLKINVAYGRLIYSQKILNSENKFVCKGDINLLIEYPILYFDCSIKSEDKKKLLKEFAIRYKKKNELLKIDFKGNINIFKNKINFLKIEMNHDYKASKEDLNYFKQLSENILLDKDFFGIFSYKKIKNFIMEIS